jgi:phosphoglycerate dehydrogenase-like enzyme
VVRFSSILGLQSFLIHQNLLEHDAVILGVFGQLMAEYVLGHIIAREREFALLRDAQAASTWNQRKSYRRLDELTLGVLGIGDIGTAIAVAACRGFNMRVVGYCNDKTARQPDSPSDPFQQLYDAKDGITSFLKEADYVISVLPHTASTAGLLDGAFSECYIFRVASESFTD